MGLKLKRGGNDTLRVSLSALFLNLLMLPIVNSKIKSTRMEKKSFKHRKQMNLIAFKMKNITAQT